MFLLIIRWWATIVFVGSFIVFSKEYPNVSTLDGFSALIWGLFTIISWMWQPAERVQETPTEPEEDVTEQFVDESICPFRETLGVDSHATTKEIKRRFKSLSMKHHPDRGGNPEIFKMYKHAYDNSIK